MSEAARSLPNVLPFSTPRSRAMPAFRMLSDKGEYLDQDIALQLTQAQAVKLYSDMLFMRIFDERMLAAQRQGRLSFYLTCKGEEAAVMAAAAALSPDDMIMSQYREHGAIRVRGFTSDDLVHQLFGTVNDLGKGRQMPMHFGSRKLNVMTVSSPLATQIPQAAGYAYAQKLEGLDACTLCYFGEGAASEGDFHAGLNMAAVLSCPVVFFCRNNHYAISTGTDEQYRGDGIISRASGYGMASMRVDGNDALAVYHVTQQARDYVLKHNVPYLIEAMTYRQGAHSSSDDPSVYRTREEEEQWAERDCIQRLYRWLVAQGWWTKQQNDVLIADYKADVLRALKQAEKQPRPGLSTLVEDVYAEVPKHLKAQGEALQQHVKQHIGSYPQYTAELGTTTD